MSEDQSSSRKIALAKIELTPAEVGKRKQCPPVLQNRIDKDKRIFALFLILMISIPVTIIPLAYFFMVDGIVEVKISDTFSFPDFKARGINYSVHDCDMSWYYNPDFPYHEYFKCYRDYKDVQMSAGMVGSTYKIASIRVGFTANITQSYTATEIMQAMMYYDMVSHIDLADYFAYNGIIMQSISISTSVTLAEMRNASVIARLPRNTRLVCVLVTVRSINYTNPYDDVYFQTTFAQFFGKDDNVIIGYDKLVVNVGGATYNDTTFSAWSNRLNDIISNGVNSTAVPIPQYYPWGVTVSTMRDPNNPYLFDPNVR